jgi:hypothetical protein
MIVKPYIASRYAEDHVNNALREVEQTRLVKIALARTPGARWRQLLILVLQTMSERLDQLARELTQAEQAQTNTRPMPR